MFEARKILIRTPGIKDRTRPCAVDLDQGLVFPFIEDFDVTDTVNKLNDGGYSPTDFIPERIERCYDAATGAPLRPASLDGPPYAKVTVAGVEYIVQKPVADYIAILAQGFTDACLKINTLEDEVAHFSGVQRN